MTLCWAETSVRTVVTSPQPSIQRWSDLWQTARLTAAVLTARPWQFPSTRVSTTQEQHSTPLYQKQTNKDRDRPVLHFIAQQTKGLQVTGRQVVYSLSSAITGIVQIVTKSILHEGSLEVGRILPEATLTFLNCLQEPAYAVSKHCKEGV